MSIFKRINVYAMHTLYHNAGVADPIIYPASRSRYFDDSNWVNSHDLRTIPYIFPFMLIMY